MALFGKKRELPEPGSEFPTVPVELAKYLITRYPQRCRRVGETELQHERYAGKAALATLLANECEKQNPGGLELDEFEKAVLNEADEEGVIMQEMLP